MFEQTGSKDGGRGIWKLPALLGAIICNRILITLADRQTWVGLLLQYLPYTIQIQPVTSTSLINGYQRILWFYTAKKKNSSLLPQIPSLRSTPFSPPSIMFFFLLHPLVITLRHGMLWRQMEECNVCILCGKECRLILKLVLCSRYNTVFSDCLSFVLMFVRLDYYLHSSLSHIHIFLAGVLSYMEWQH